jgi:pimeloyl-ACP methyl ester carboxylesterase
MDLIGLRDGRRLAMHRLAEGTTGRTVVLCHAAPGSGVFDPDPEATWSRGVTLLSPDRPGYGSSDPPVFGAGGFPAAADDLAEALDHLDTGPVGLAGWSAGGLVALALAARRPDLVDRLVLIATPAPDDQIPWMPAGLRATSALPVSDDPGRWIGLLSSAGPGTVGSATAGAGPDGSNVAGPDAAALDSADGRLRLEAMLREAFRQGEAGLAADRAAILSPWGFEPGQIAAKTLLLYGAKDPIVGPRQGKWYQPRLQNARYEQSPNTGHLVILPTWRRALAHLAPGAKR